MQIFKNPNYDFVKYRWHAIALSLAVILAGVAVIGLRGLPLGVDFSGGTNVIVQFDQMPSIDGVRAAIDPAVPGGAQNAVVQQYGPAADREVLIRVPHVGAESGAQLGETAEKLQEALENSGLGAFKVIGTEIVGPVVGQDLTRKGISATVLSLAGILVFIAFRFRLSFAVGAVVATVHDLIVMLSFIAFFGYELSLNIIAAILTIVGYSVNDTVVVFDRVRENLRGTRKDDIAQIVNTAVNQTLGRTVITAGTSLLSVIALFLFGGEVLRGFAFTMIVGIIAGTYSTVYIAVAIVTFWRRRQPVRAAVAPSGGQPASRAAQTARVRTKPSKKARTT